MDFDTVERGGSKRIYSRLGPPADRPQKVCYHWQAGRCNRPACSFLHTEVPPKRQYQTSVDDPRNFQEAGFSKRNHNSNPTVASAGHNGHTSKWGRSRGGGAGARFPRKKLDVVCNYWVQEKCAFGEGCRYMHSWFVGETFTFLTLLEGHQKAVSAIALPSGSDKLYSGSKDESVRIWDCQTGQCAGIVNLGGEIGCMISEGSWIFVGLPNVVKAWNTQTNVDISLNGPVGLVYALVAINDVLFAGTQEGNILVWRFNAAGNCFEPAASLNGHRLAVVSMAVGARRLFSGSMDCTIKVWDLETLQCIQTLTDHTDVVMSVLCYDQFLLSCSLDQTIKVWVTTESGGLEVTYTHKEEHGILSLCGVHDAHAKPVLLCSCNDNCVRLYDLPSFGERGKILSKAEVRAIQVGPGGLFFTGDGGGELKVWKWSPTEPSSA